MLERLGRLCVGLGFLWVVVIVGFWLMVGLDRPDESASSLSRFSSMQARETSAAGRPSRGFKSIGRDYSVRGRRGEGALIQLQYTSSDDGAKTAPFVAGGAVSFAL